MEKLIKNTLGQWTLTKSTPGLEQTTPFAIGALHADKILDNHQIATHHIKLHEAAAQRATSEPSAAWHRNQADQIYQHISGKKLYDPEANRHIIS